MRNYKKTNNLCLISIGTLTKRPVQIILYSLIFLLLSNTTVQARADIEVGFGHHKHPYVMLDDSIEKDVGHKKHHGIEFGIIKQTLLRMGLSLKTHAIEPNSLKRAIRNFKKLDAVSGVNLSKDKFHYSDPILEIEYLAITKAKNKIDLKSTSDITPFSIIAREGVYSTLGRGFNKAYNPRSGSHKMLYYQYSRDIDLHKRFWTSESDLIMIADREAFEHYKAMLKERYDTSEPVNFSSIFPQKSRYYVAFRNKKLRDEFNDALSTLKFEGTYQRILDHYGYLSDTSKSHRKFKL